MKKHKIIIIGGGFAGLRAFYRLNKQKYLDITIIDKRSKSVEKPSLPEVAFSGKDVNKVLIDLKEIVEHHHGDYINDEVIKINPELNHIHLKNGEKLTYDYLIIAAGAYKAFDAIKGFNEFGYSMCDEHYAVKLWDKLKSFKGGNIVIGTAKSTFGNRVDAPKLLEPCEGPVGEAMFMIDHLLRHKELREKSTIKVFTPGEIFFEDIGSHVRNKVGAVMGERNISLANNKVITEITKTDVKFEDGTFMVSDFTIIIPPYKTFPLYKDSGLGDDAGFIPTDRTMKHLDFDNIYAVGDINALAQPKLGHIAVHQADIAVSAILKELNGKGEIIEYKPSVFCIMNMGGVDATLIFSDSLYNGKNDLAFHNPLAHTMKWGFDSYYFYTKGHMPPDFSTEGFEKFLSLFQKDASDEDVLNDRFF